MGEVEPQDKMTNLTCFDLAGTHHLSCGYPGIPDFSKSRNQSVYTKFTLHCTTVDEAKDDIFKIPLTCSSQMKVSTNMLMHFD